MNEKRYYRDEAKKNWHRGDGGAPDLEQLKFGALQRIADALEVSVREHEQLKRSHEWYKECYDKHIKKIATLERRVAALRGVITKMKRKASQ